MHTCGISAQQKLLFSPGTKLHWITSLCLLQQKVTSIIIMYIWKTIHITIILKVPKLFAIFLIQPWKRNAIFRNSRNHTFSFLNCLPTATRNTDHMWTLKSDIAIILSPMSGLQSLFLPCKSILGVMEDKGHCPVQCMYEQNYTQVHVFFNFQQNWRLLDGGGCGRCL